MCVGRQILIFYELAEGLVDPGYGRSFKNEMDVHQVRIEIFVIRFGLLNDI